MDDRFPGPAEPEQPELTLEEIHEGNRRGLWVILALAAIAVIIFAIFGVKDIFIGRF